MPAHAKRLLSVHVKHLMFRAHEVSGVCAHEASGVWCVKHRQHCVCIIAIYSLEWNISVQN